WPFPQYVQQGLCGDAKWRKDVATQITGLNGDNRHMWTMGKMMRGAKTAMFAAMAASVLALATPVVAQEVAPEHLALARKYIDLTDRGAIFETTVVEVGIEAMRQIVTQNPEILNQTNDAIGEVIKEYNGRKGELLDQFARV